MESKKNRFWFCTLWKYAQTVGPAYLGAPTHPGKKKEKEYPNLMKLDQFMWGSWNKTMGKFYKKSC